MARFDVYTYSAKVPYVVDVQADLLSDLKTRVVVPLLPFSKAKQEYAERLKPVIKVKGKKFILMTTDIGTLHQSDLKNFVDNIEEQRDTVTQALDFLFQGF